MKPIPTLALRTSLLRGRVVRTLLMAVAAWALTAPAHAQTPTGLSQDVAPPVVTSEEVEPRILGNPGTLTLGFAGYAERSFSTENYYSTLYTAQVDASYFLTRKLVVRGGLAGSGAFGGDEDTTWPSGVGVPALHAFGGAFYYFTPRSIWSVYGGADYWIQWTQRPERDAGLIVPTVGLQAALSSRASVFVEYGYGFGLARGAENELITRMSGRVGIRLRLRE